MDIAAMKQSAEAATPGPWEIKESLGVDEAWCEWHSVGPFTLPGECAEKDDRFIAAAHPAAVLELIASHEQLVAALRDCVSVMDRDLSGLAVIQPELRAARVALAAAGAA